MSTEIVFESSTWEITLFNEHQFHYLLSIVLLLFTLARAPTHFEVWSWHNEQIAVLSIYWF